MDAHADGLGPVAMRPEGAWDREGDLPGARGDEVVKDERGLVRDDRPVRADLKPRGQDIIKRRGRELPEAVQTASHALKASSADVIREVLPGIAGLAGLPSREVPALDRGSLTELRLVGT
jgi:hypothetical protein